MNNSILQRLVNLITSQWRVVRSAYKTIIRQIRTTHYVLRIILIVLTALIISVPPVIAQSFDAKVDFYIATPAKEQNFTVGDYIPLRLEIRHPAASRATLPQVPEDWEGITVISQSETTRVDNGDGTATTGKDIVVSLYEPGSYQTPRLIVTHYKADGGSEDLGTPVIPIKIGSVLVEGDEELRDLKPQAELPTPPIWPWVLAGFLLSVLLAGLIAGAGLWIYHRFRRQAILLPEPTPLIDMRPPEVIAYAELDRIEALNLPAKKQFKEHYSLVTNCLRRYIEGRYHIPALERTTGEIRVAFLLVPLPSNNLREFMYILTEGDFVKFARYRPGLQDAYNLVRQARRLVEATTPQPKTVVEPPKPEMEVVA
jgi:hypothetical protein